MSALDLSASVERWPITTSYLVGVSGGRDSVALLHALRDAGYRDLTVVHLHHGLRKEAAGDAVFTRALAKRLGYPIVTKKVDVKALAKRLGKSLEAAGRQARLEFFAEAARERGCPRVFLAHHADDQVETVLMNLFRGTGAGLAGMREESELAVSETKLLLLRPWLSVWREEIDRFVEARGLRFREDATNAERDFLRNRLRLDLLPALKETLGRDPRAAVWRLSRQQAAENDLLDSLTPPFDGEVKALRSMPLALRRRAMLRWLRDCCVPSLDFDLIERAVALAEPGAVAAVINLPGGQFLRRRAGRLFLATQEKRDRLGGGPAGKRQVS